MIGILDSGLGGLSVLREIHRLLPQHSFLYIADSAWCPYGAKSYDQIHTRVTTLVDHLIQHGAELIVIACNSATIACVEYLRANYLIPIVGMEPGVKPASQITTNGKVGVFATEASLAGAKFHRLLNTHAQDIEVITQPCPDFVTLVESGTLTGPAVEAAIQQYITPMIDADTIVLGCTHYPFLKNTIAQLYPDKHLIDTGTAVAKQVQRKLPTTQRITAPPQQLFLTTGSATHASQLLPQLCPEFSAHQFSTLSENT